MIINKMEDLRQRYNPDGSSLRRAQLRMVEILKEVDKICRKHNIPYYLEGGTLLGAIRHKGFIPWDDDLDISVLKRDFPRLKKALQEELPDNLIYQDRWTDFNCPIIFAKVRDKHSFFDEYDSRRVKERGIFIDIFPNEKIPSMWWKRKVDYPYGHCIRGIHNYTDTKDKILSYIVFPFAWTIVLLTRFVNLFIPSDKIAFIYGWNVTYNNYSINDVFPVTYVPFEDMMAPVPHNYDIVLTRLFGDYMQIPPEEKRKVHSAKIEFYDE